MVGRFPLLIFAYLQSFSKRDADGARGWHGRRHNHRNGREPRVRGYSGGIQNFHEQSTSDFRAVCGGSRERWGKSTLLKNLFKTYSLFLSSFLTRRRKAAFRILNGTCSEYGDFPWIAQVSV